MTANIDASNLSLGWLSAMEHLLEAGGRDTNVIVTISHIEEEEPPIRHLLDAFLERIDAVRREPFYTVSTVANTLFPQSLYYPERGEGARAFLYQQYEQSFQIKKRLLANRAGTYFRRMVAWQGRKGEVNQLEGVIGRLKAGLQRSNTLSSAYELGVSDVEEISALEDTTEEIHIYQPGRDNQLMGFPCLSHISLTLFHRKLHLTALYRNQHFIRKAYGNYLGLSRLLRFLCREVDCEPGELVCIASHADAELVVGKRAIKSLVVQCRAAVASVEHVHIEK